MHGVVGPQWKIPVGETTGAYKHIASPMPQPDWSARIQPTYLPPNTHSHTSWDLPQRLDVVQVELPYGNTHTQEMYQDPRNPRKMPVAVVSGSLYHNTWSTNEEINKWNNMVATAANPQTYNWEFVFAEKRSRNKVRKNKSKSKSKSKSRNRSRSSQLPPPGGKILKD